MLHIYTMHGTHTRPRRLGLAELLLFQICFFFLTISTQKQLRCFSFYKLTDLTSCAGYAYEIQTPLGGRGMEFVLGQRQYALNGVLNGIDYETWSPEKDKLIPHNYSKNDLTGKLWCKADLQKELGLPQDADRPLIAFIGRLDSQKGADLILAASHWIMQQVRTIVVIHLY